MERENAARYLEQLLIFKGFSAVEKEVFATVLHVRKLQAGDKLCGEGEPGSSFYIVVAGEVANSRRLPGGRALELGTTGPGRIAGQKALIDGRKQASAMKASKPTIVLECNRADFQRLFNANSVLAYKVLDVVVTDLSRRLREVDVVLENLLSDPSRTLASVLDVLSSVSGMLGDGTDPDAPKKYHVDV